jgi:RNA polymerase sigma-70 factor (ECF subfamily)
MKPFRLHSNTGTEPAASPTLAGMSLPPVGGSRAVTPVTLALRDGLRRFVARKVAPQHVDDLVQDILLRMHERAGDLRDETRVAGWAFRIALNVVNDHHRGARPERTLADTDDPPAEANDSTNLNEVVAGWLDSMVALLPDEYAEALQRVDVEGMSQRDFAALSGLSLSGAKSRVQRGRHMLEDIVRACCDIELDVQGNVIDYRRRSCRRES